MAPELATALIGLAGAVIGGGISSLTTWLVARGEREKYRRERSWDLRREAYTTIIGALDRARSLTKYVADYKGDPDNWEPTNRKALTQMIEHFHTARTAFHANRLMLSKAFVAEYDEMNFQLEDTQNQDRAPLESAAIASNIMQKMVPKMEDLAIKELGVAT